MSTITPKISFSEIFTDIVPEAAEELFSSDSEIVEDADGHLDVAGGRALIGLASVPVALKGVGLLLKSPFVAAFNAISEDGFDTEPDAKQIALEGLAHVVLTPLVAGQSLLAIKELGQAAGDGAKSVFESAAKALEEGAKDAADLQVAGYTSGT